MKVSLNLYVITFHVLLYYIDDIKIIIFIFILSKYHI